MLRKLLACSRKVDWSSELEEVILLSSPDMNCRHLMPRFHAAEVFVYICNQSKVYIEVLFFSFLLKRSYLYTSILKVNVTSANKFGKLVSCYS